MENLIYQITNEIKSLDAYVNAMKKVEDRKPKLEDLENLQMHINNLKAWAGIDDSTSENSLHKHIVTQRSEPFCSCNRNDYSLLELITVCGKCFLQVENKELNGG